jgi:superfamily II DNA or RNA helicase
MSCFGLRLTPRGHLVLEKAEDGLDMDEAAAARLTEAFARGTGAGLVQLGAGEVGQVLPPSFSWWREFAGRYVTSSLLHRPGTSDDKPVLSALPEVAAPDAAELAALVLTAPMMPGSEYLAPDVLRALWVEMGTALAAALTAAKTDLQSFLKRLNPAWNLVGRVHFNLAENCADPEFPFAFMATYTTQLSAQVKAQHVPLGRALRDYAGAANKDKLLALLLPVQRAADACPWLKAMVDTGTIFQPLRWSPQDASQLLASTPGLEAAGIVVRMPATWRANRPLRPRMTATVGARAPSALGLDGLLDFRAEMMLDGEPLTEQEIRTLLAGTEGLMLLRGRWVEVDRTRLGRTLQRFREAEQLAEEGGLTFREAMRMLAGAAIARDDDDGDDAAAADWSRVTAGPWLARTLQTLRSPDGAGADPGPTLNGTLRPYQKAGVQWLHLLSGLGLGACLADDMGLGKTIQVLALLLVQQAKRGSIAAQPSLLVAPASLLANWMAEIERFAPSLKARIVHPSAMTAAEARQFTSDHACGLDLVITSYGSLLRSPGLAQAAWRLAILDEAQAVKNPQAKQTKAVRALTAQSRIALTGTPVENHLGDLWSIFDVINPGLLGTARQFSRYAKGLSGRELNPYGPLRELVRPYILRRMKTDKSIIADLPDKTEVKAYCNLSRRQAALYAQAVEDLAESLEDTDGIQRKGVVLATLTRLKQICNHPSQWLGDQAWAEEDSGKWARLREIAEVVASRQEKMLVFAQFREVTEPLATFLGGIFGRPGLVLHGQTEVKRRKALVQAFQADEAVPFFVLSLKAGGAGLTLTAASHVVHFDRWWNPAVENQATDRAFRIGQRRNVLVQKFVCRGTVEEKIDALIESKRDLSEGLLAGPGEINLTEMSNDALLKMVALDIHSAMKD